MPVDVNQLEKLLISSNYDAKETEFLVKGFKQGFDIGYRGPNVRQDLSQNIPFTKGVGDSTELWNKVIKEVELGRFAGPYRFKDLPYQNYIQSPIGLVPKAGGQTRLIFHLSYKFKNGNESLNYWTPRDMGTVNYNDLNHAVLNSIRINGTIFYSKTDLKSAFRIFCTRPDQRCYLLLKAQDPLMSEWFYFINLCMPFGASISCAHFQRFSNALKHLVEHATSLQFSITNYLDDFLFISNSARGANMMVRKFIQICDQIKFPISFDKTEWATPRIIFLGMLLDGETHAIAVPEDKRIKALNMVTRFAEKRKAMVHELQQLAGTLNFLNRAIVPGRPFMRRMYSKYVHIEGLQTNGSATMGTLKKTVKLKQHHHVRVDAEFRNDCKVWKTFLEHQSVVNRPMINFDTDSFSASQLKFFTDSSRNELLGFGCIYNSHWTFGQWENNFIRDCQPSICYLELFAVCVGIFTWAEELRDMRIEVFCDNQGAVEIINSSSSKCKNCLLLVKMLTLNNLMFNRRVFARFIPTKENFLADSLSRLKFEAFFHAAGKNIDKHQTKLPSQLWPLSKLWIN